MERNKKKKKKKDMEMEINKSGCCKRHRPLSSSCAIAPGDEYSDAGYTACTIWAALPQDLLLQHVISSKLNIKDLLRMRAVSRSWNTAIAALCASFTNLNIREVTPHLHLPWFYCIVAKDQSRTRSLSYACGSKQPAAFDPAMNTWHWLPLPATSLQARLDATPICSVQSLVCWRYRVDTWNLRDGLMLSKTFSGVCQELDHLSNHLQSAPPFTSQWKCVGLERHGDGLTGNLSLVLLCSAKDWPGVIRIERYKYHGQQQQQQQLSHQQQPAVAPAAVATSTVDDDDDDAKLPNIATCVEKSLQCLYGDGSPQHSMPERVYYHAGTLAFLQYQPLYAGDRHKLPDLLIYNEDEVTCRRIGMPAFSRSLNVMRKASYQIVQMDTQLLMLVLKRKPTFATRQVFVYRYNFMEQGWLLLSNDLIVPFDVGSSDYFEVDSIARAGLLMLFGYGKAYLCRLRSMTTRQSNAWRSVPHCCAFAGGPSFSILEVACPIDPILC